MGEIQKRSDVPKKQRKRSDKVKAAMHYLQSVEAGEIPEILDDIVKQSMTLEEEMALELARQFGQS